MSIIVYVFPKTVTLLITAKQNVQYDLLHRCYSTTQFVVVSLCCVSRHDDMKFIAAFFF